MSLVLAADYRVPDFDHWWAALAGDLPRLPGLGAHHVVVYRSLADASRVFVTIGVAGRGPVDTLLRSPVAEACGAGSVCGRCNHTIRTMIEDAAPDPPPRKPDRLRRRWGRS
jgi:hypothetical protein